MWFSTWMTFWSTHTFEEHLVNLDTVIHRLTKTGFTLNAMKFRFCLEEVKFLCHCINKTGVSADPNRLWHRVVLWTDIKISKARSVSILAVEHALLKSQCPLTGLHSVTSQKSRIRTIYSVKISKHKRTFSTHFFYICSPSIAVHVVQPRQLNS